MKLRKVALILGLSVCIAGTQVQMTFGTEKTAIEDPESVQDEDQNKDQDVEDQKSEEEPTDEEDQNPGSESNQDKDKKTDTEANKIEATNPGQPDNSINAGENTGIEKPGTDENKTEKPDTENPDADGNKEDGNKTEGNEAQAPDPGQPDHNGNAGDNQDTDANKGETPDPESPDAENPDTVIPDTENPDQDNSDTETPDAEVPEEPEQAAPPAEEETPEAEDTYSEPEADTPYSGDIYTSYSASIKFLDDAEKIKYNVSVPIKGLPSFITQEMIVAALKCQDETGYPASVTIAQIIQESGYGKYGPGGEDGKGLSYLAYQYNNLFGIKGTGPAGSVDMITGEQSKDGTMFTTVSGFRVYNTYTECIEDRTKLLKEVYSDLTLGVEDANTFAMKIGSRWATSLIYGQSLIRQMEEYDLYRLDDMTLGQFSNLLGTFVNPCPGAVLTSNFGLREEPIAGAGNGHNGIDLGTGEYNIPTYAAAAGTVTYAGEAGTAGNLVIIDHGKGLITKYMHHEKIFVEEGQKVEKGQQIGLSGTTGMSTGNHLHFQVEKNGTPVDPMQFFTVKQQESFNK